jgi:hypothetical protein
MPVNNFDFRLTLSPVFFVHYSKMSYPIFSDGGWFETAFLSSCISSSRTGSCNAQDAEAKRRSALTDI